MTGTDSPVVEFLKGYPETEEFARHTAALADMHIDNYLKRGFSDLMLCFGCTGGRHRSVYFAERLAEHIAGKYRAHSDRLKVSVFITYSSTLSNISSIVSGRLLYGNGAVNSTKSRTRIIYALQLLAELRGCRLGYSTSISHTNHHIVVDAAYKLNSVSSDTKKLTILLPGTTSSNAF